MAYLSVKEDHEGRSASVDQRYQRSYRRVFRVVTSAPTYGPYYAGSAPGLPLVWDAHDEDSSAYCLGYSVDQDQGDPCIWKLTFNYGYNADAANGGGAGGATGATGATGNPAIDTQQQGYAPADRVLSPLSRPRDYNITSVAFPEAVMHDSKGWQICNSAGDPILPALERQRYGANITVGLNYASAPSSSWFAALGRVNAASLTIGPYTSMPAKTVRLSSLAAQFVNDTGLSYWRWTLVFEYRPFTTSWTDPTNPYNGWVQLGSSWPSLGWKAVLIDQGRREYYAGTGQWKEITDPPLHTPVSQPVLLDGSGFRLAISQRAYYKAWDIYEETTFPSPL